MHPLLARLDRWLTANRPAYHAGLLSGASAADIDEVARHVDGELPPMLRELLTWRNGQSVEDEEVLESHWALMSAESIASTMDEMAWLVENDNFGEFWGTDWVPFLGNFYSDHMCVDLRAVFGGEPGQIVKFSGEVGFQHIAYPSLEAWLETLVVALETGTFNESGDERCFPVDRESYEAFVADRNPGYPIEVCRPDSHENTRPEPIEGFRQLVHAADPDRLRTALQGTGLNNGVVDVAFARLNEIRTRAAVQGM